MSDVAAVIIGVIGGILFWAAIWAVTIRLAEGQWPWRWNR